MGDIKEAEKNLRELDAEGSKRMIAGHRGAPVAIVVAAACGVGC